MFGLSIQQLSKWRSVQLAGSEAVVKFTHLQLANGFVEEQTAVSASELQFTAKHVFHEPAEYQDRARKISTFEQTGSEVELALVPVRISRTDNLSEQFCCRLEVRAQVRPTASNKRVVND